MSKLIIKTALITLGIIVGLLGIVCLIIGVFFPIKFATLFESTGSYSASYYFYEQAYGKSTDINKTYTLLDKAIQFKLDSKVVKYYEKLSAYDRYDEFIDFVNKNNYDQDSKVLVNVMMSNEDNRLKTRYVSSLANRDLDKAFKFAVQDLYKTSIVDGQLNVNFVIAGLYEHINADTIKYFQNSEYSKNSTLVADQIKNNFDALYTLYQGKKTDSSNYVLALYSGKLVDMCQTMILVDKFLDDSLINTSYDADYLTQTLTTIVAEYQTYSK